MKGHPDENMIFERMDSGLTGVCYTERRPAICNLEQIGALAAAKTLKPEELFNMEPEQHASVMKGCTWLASVPIFDPFDSSYRATTSSSRQRTYGRYYYVLPSVVDGAILGVLNVDANWSYQALGLDPEVERHYTDDRVRTILDLMQQTSLRLGRIFGMALGRRDKPNA
jgi:hypothetical protein